MNKNQKRILESVTPRVIELVSKGMDVIEATKQALIEQINLSNELITQSTERGVKAKEALLNRVYLHHNKN